MADTKKKISVYDIVLIGLMAALVFVGTYLHIDIPTPLGKAMIHFGNIFCLLAGMLLGGVRGGLAAGIGSMIYDMLDPAYISECWITFINKFAMAFLCGIIVSFGVKKIKELHEKSENGTAAQSVSGKTKVLLSIGCCIMAVLAGYVGYLGYGVISAFANGTQENVLSGVIKIVGAVILIAALVYGIVLGLRKVLGKEASDEDAAGKEKSKLFTYRLIGGIAGIVGYVILYLFKNFVFGLIQGQEMATIQTTLVTKGSISLINGVIAVVISMVLVPYFVMAMQRAGFEK